MQARQSVLAVFDNYFTLAAHRRFQGWDMDLMQRLRAGLTDAGAEGRTVFVVEVQEREANINDAMHGGAVATLFDMCMTTAVAPLARRGFWEFLGGVSRAM